MAVSHRVLIAGGGVAGLEALVALHSLAREDADLTLVAPDETFQIRAMSVEDPFARPEPRTWRLDAICADHGARLVRGALDAVDPAGGTAAIGGRTEPFDSLLVAIGARPVPVYERVITFRGAQDAEAMHGLVQDVESGHSRTVAFVVPPGVTWPLPLYELALMTAERAAGVGMDALLSIVTPEASPLEVFGADASEAVDEALAAAGIAVVTGTEVDAVEDGQVLAGGRCAVRAERVVALPRLEGPRVAGLPADDGGFIPVDDHGRVEGLENVFAAGDGTTTPIKQGGLAAQQADAAARAIAVRAGAAVEPAPFRPILRAKLLTGSRSRWLRHAVRGPAVDSEVSEQALWWPPTKVMAPYLAPYLERTSG